MGKDRATSFEEFLRATDELISPVLAKYGFVTTSSIKDGKWIYIRFYENSVLRLRVVLEVLEFYTSIDLLIEGSSTEGVPLSYVVKELGYMPKEYSSFNSDLKQSLDRFLFDLKSYAKILDQYASDVLLGHTKLRFENGSLIVADGRRGS